MENGESENLQNMASFWTQKHYLTTIFHGHFWPLHPKINLKQLCSEFGSMIFEKI